MDTLFHYTTAAGLLGILNTANIWATDLRFLNDVQEAVYAYDIAVDANKLIWKIRYEDRIIGHIRMASLQLRRSRGIRNSS
jgi:hypothetical protein